MQAAFNTGRVVPGFNIPYLPMMEPVVRALRDSDCFGLIMVARLEWEKFGAGSLEAVRDEYERLKDERFTRLHLDHVPVIDEDGRSVDYEAILGRAIDLGYDSVMVDGSRLPLADNIAATKRVVEMARTAGVPAHGIPGGTALRTGTAAETAAPALECEPLRGVPVEAELGAVLGHEAGPLPPYDELFASGRGFTDPAEAGRFVAETGCDWLSVAIGNVHGAISGTARDRKKVEARLNIKHLRAIRDATGIPLVLHGGTGIAREYVREAIRAGIAKINVATAIRQPYMALMDTSADEARTAVYEAVTRIIRQDLGADGSAALPNRGTA